MPTIKVDRIANHEELELFRDLGVDLFGFSCCDHLDAQRWIHADDLYHLMNSYPTLPFVSIYDSDYPHTPALERLPLLPNPSCFIQSVYTLGNPDQRYAWIASHIFSDLEDSAYVLEQCINPILGTTAVYGIVQIGVPQTDSWKRLQSFSYEPEYEIFRRQDEFLVIDELTTLIDRYPLFLSLEWIPETWVDIATTFGPHARYTFTLADPTTQTNLHVATREEVIAIVQFLTSFDYEFGRT